MHRSRHIKTRHLKIRILIIFCWYQTKHVVSSFAKTVNCVFVCGKREAARLTCRKITDWRGNHPNPKFAIHPSLAASQSVVRPSVTPVHPSIRLPSNPPPSAHFNLVENQKPVHLQVHQSTCQVQQPVDNWPFHRPVLRPPRLSSWQSEQTTSSEHQRRAPVINVGARASGVPKPRPISTFMWMPGELSFQCYFAQSRRGKQTLLFAWMTEK